ncbi:plasma membrane ferric-chelate reductase [Grosmannia clavigera kw1407]|uniref:Plasma membrane ferric-chelate reductase n=1 Tax=Grosmannia clavigera (strain kw1407 / UAMH 11150) TaxID=655863 RepID=F0X850_GROCL|nr:plasma membrane ferric-chelate reductase [Grosmannia clavigera kw1407]EFX05475.1 plasma membrane ferric-chelate reductase [Grosmannia clavigera kw1407]
MDQRKSSSSSSRERGWMTSSTCLLWILLAVCWTGVTADVQQQQQRVESLGSPVDGWLEVPDGLTASDLSDLFSPSFLSLPLSHQLRPRNAPDDDDEDDDGETLRPRPRSDRARCSDACQMVVGAVAYVDVAPASRRVQKACGSRLLQTSLYLCLRVYCAGYHEAAGIERLNRTCATVGDSSRQPEQNVLPPYHDLVSGYSDEDVAQLRRLQPSDVDFPPANISEAVVPSEALYRNGYDTLDDWLYVHKHHLAYSTMMLLFWMVVVIVGISCRMAAVVKRAARRIVARSTDYQPLAGRAADGLDADADADADEAALAKSSPLAVAGRPGIWLRRYVTLPAAFGYRCAQDFGWYTVPPRVQSLTIAVFVAINVLSCVQGYQTFSGNMYYPLVHEQLLRYVSDRTGIVSYANFPLIWLFGMRNNVLLWLTGWDFGTFNNFHRWVARVATVQAIIHSIGYTLLMCRNDGLAAFVEWWAIFFWWTGGVATISMSLLLGFSLYWMRRHVYEAFLVLHIVLSILVLAGMLGHVSIFHGRFDGLVWTCTAVWLADRVLRSLRILAFHPRFWHVVRAAATYDAQSNLVRLVVPYSTSLYQPRPGTFYYLHVLDGWRFWESHPFTVASVGGEAEPDAKPGPSSSFSALDDSSATIRVAGHTPYPSTMTFLVRPYDGFTARLRDKAATAFIPASLPVLVDGPYGHAPPLATFDAVLFVVGGSGVVVPLSHLSGIGRASRLRAVHVVWAAREAAMTVDIIRTDFAGLLDGNSTVRLDVHITSADNSGSLPLPDIPDLPRQARLLVGRPDVRGEVECAVKNIAPGCRLAVVACGPARMADDARRAVVDLLGSPTCGHVEYFEESFQW